MDSGFKFGDKATWNFSMHVQKLPSQSAPARKRQTISVPGRNGDLHLQENAFDNLPVPYNCYFHGSDPAPDVAHAVKAWLLSSGAYQRLEDTYDPKHFRLAAFAGPLDIENRFNRYGVCTVIFDCDPRAFLKSGETMIEFAEAGTLINPTAFNALPLITVYGTGPGTVTVGTTTVTIHAITEPIVLDCEQQEAYSQPGEGAPENKNADICAIPFPELLPGENAVAFDGDITKVEIIPRWWEL